MHDPSHVTREVHRIVKPVRLRASADLNVTPLIDVLLVLLVIFMAALPVTQQGVDVNVPQAVAPPDTPVDSTQIVAEIDASSRLTINHEPTSLPALEGRLREIFAARREKTLFLMGAGTLRYGAVMAVIDAAKGAGVERLGVITDEMRSR